MIKSFLLLLRYKIFYKLELFSIGLIISIKNLILHPNNIVGIYDLQYRDLSYDIYEYLCFLNIRKKYLGKAVIIYIYSANKFESDIQFSSFFLKILNHFNVKYILINKKFITKYNLFFFNTHFLDNRTDDIPLWDQINPNKLVNFKFLKKIPKYQNKINFFLKKNKLDKKKLVTLTIRNNPASKQYNTPKKLIIKIFNFLKKLNYHPLIINDNIYPMNFDKNFKVLNSNDFLFRSQFYTYSILNISTSRGAGNLIITLPINWIIFNFEKSGIKRYKIFKKINNLKNNFSELVMTFNDFNSIKKVILNFSKSNARKQKV